MGSKPFSNPWSPTNRGTIGNGCSNGCGNGNDEESINQSVGLGEDGARIVVVVVVVAGQWVKVKPNHNSGGACGVGGWVVGWVWGVLSIGVSVVICECRFPVTTVIVTVIVTLVPETFRLVTHKEGG